MAELWGGETRKAVENFPVSGERVPVPVVRWLGRIKGAAARVNAELGLLDADLAERIATAADAVAAGEHDDQFPIDVFQTGSGTSSNMNANEVIATLAGDDAHANDHVNMGQSSNDVFPSAVHLAALEEISKRLLPALDHLGERARREGRGVRRRRQGRPHAPDGRGAGDARSGVRRLRGPDPARPRADRRRPAAPRPDPPRRHGDRHGPQHPPRVRRARARAPDERHRPADRAAGRPVRGAGRPRRAGRGVGRLKVLAVSLTKIANDIAWMGSGPRAGLAEIFLPELQKGSSIMPGKVNPVIPEVVLQVAAQVIGNDTAITIAGTQGNFELNVRIPLIARNLLGSIHLLTPTSTLFADRCVAGIEANPRAPTATARTRSPWRPPSTPTSATTGRPRSSRRPPPRPRAARGGARARRGRVGPGGGAQPGPDRAAARPGPVGDVGVSARARRSPTRSRPHRARVPSAAVQTATRSQSIVRSARARGRRKEVVSSPGDGGRRGGSWLPSTCRPRGERGGHREPPPWRRCHGGFHRRRNAAHPSARPVGAKPHSAAAGNPPSGRADRLPWARSRASHSTGRVAAGAAHWGLGPPSPLPTESTRGPRRCADARREPAPGPPARASPAGPPS